MRTLASVGVGRDPVGLHQLLGMRVGHGQQRQHRKHAAKFSACGGGFPLQWKRERYDSERRVGAGGGRGPGGARPRRAISSRAAPTVTVIDVRDRVGGRVWTIRDGFAEGQHAEAGGDLIDEDQHEIRDAGRRRRAQADAHPQGRLRLRARRPDRPRRGSCARNAMRRLGAAGRRAARAVAGPTRWPSGAGTRRSPPTWRAARSRRGSIEVKADADLRATATGLRGFFLADPDELSLIALVDQFAESEPPAPGGMYRIEGGNDRLATALAEPLGDRLHLSTDVVALSHRGKVVRVSVKNNRALAQINCDYAILALPATLLRRMPITPALPAQQHEAIVRLKYGRATQDAAAVLEALLARARPAARVRLAAAVRRGVGRQRGTARPRRHPDAARRRRRQRRDAGDRRQARRARPDRRARLARLEGQRAARLAADRRGSRIRTRAAATPIFDPASIRRCARGCRGRPAGCSSPASTPASSGRAT